METPPQITGLNHITLSISDLNRSTTFYREILGMKLRAQWDKGAYLEAGSLWLCLMVSETQKSIGGDDYSHIAFDIEPENFAALSQKIAAVTSQWQENSSEGNSHYFRDPDGHKLEIHCGSLESRLTHYREQGAKDVQIFD